MAWVPCRICTFPGLSWDLSSICGSTWLSQFKCELSPNNCLPVSSAKLAASCLFLWPGISLASVPVGQDRRSRHTTGSGPWAQYIAERKGRDGEKLHRVPPGYHQASYLGLFTNSKSSKEAQWWKRKQEEIAKSLQTPDWFTSCYRCGQSLWGTYWDFQVLGPGTHESWWKKQFLRKRKSLTPHLNPSTWNVKAGGPLWDLGYMVYMVNFRPSRAK